MRVPLLVGLTLLVAGCAQPDEGAPADVAANASATGAGGEAPTSEPVNDDGTKAETAIGTAQMPHLHDYWQGKERVTLFEGTLEPDAFNLTFATFFQALVGRDAVVGGMQFWLPDGTIVYEGTGVMEITATWSDPRITGIGFVYQSAELVSGSNDFHIGGSLPNGEAFALELKPEQTDMPHAKSSRWWFGFGPDSSPGMLAGPFDLKIDIVKVNDIMTFPAHPDFWQGAPELKLIDTDHHGEVPSYAKRVAQPATQGNFTEDWVNFDHPVPMETKAVRLTATITAATSTPGKVDAFGFFYHGADTQIPFRCPIKPLNGPLPQEITWTVPFTMEMTDSPYAEGSIAQFLVEPIVVLADGAPRMGGMTDVSYDYRVVAYALDSEPEEMDSCSRDDG